MSAPRLVVCVGGGGVGKTTTSAAIAVAAARAGHRTLVVTIDPARRLADALGVELGADIQAVPLNDAPGAELYALMPRPQAALRSFAELLFGDEPAALQRMLDNRLYRVLEDSVPGIHELVTANLVGTAIAERRFDLVVIDTAPSRHAVDFVTYPDRIAKLLRGRVIRWLSRLAPRSAGRSGGAPPSIPPPSLPPPSLRPSIPAPLLNRAQGLLERVLGPAIFDVADLFGELLLVRPRFVELNQAAASLLLGPDARYLLVAAPTGGAIRDVAHLRSRLLEMGLSPRLVIVNGAASAMPPWDAALGDAELGPALAAALEALRRERGLRATATDAALATLSQIDPGLPRLTLPQLEPAEPTEIVTRLADTLAPELEQLLGDMLPERPAQ